MNTPRKTLLDLRSQLHTLWEQEDENHAEVRCLLWAAYSAINTILWVTRKEPA